MLKQPLPVILANTMNSPDQKNGDNNNDELSEVDDDDRDGDYKQVESSDDDDDLSLAARKLVLPTSLFDYSDDEFDHLLDDKELDEDAKRIEYANLRKRETIGRCKGTLLKEGPQEPSYEEMMAGKEKAARKEYQNKRKKWRDQKRSKRLQANNTTDFNDDDFTSNLFPTLRTMSDVCATHLERDHLLFPDRDLVLLCIFEEASFCGTHYTVKKGNDCQLYCTSPGFLIYAAHSVRKEWLVTRCEIFDTESAIDMQPNTNQHGSCSPFRTNMIIPLIATTIAKTPMASNKVLRMILEPYGKAYCFTDKHFTKLTNQSMQAYPRSTSGQCWLHIIPQGQVGEVGPFCVALFYKPKGNHKEYRKGYYC
jgi:hypothetical protein